jgi:AcrR family transcriptional regulator
MADVTAERGAVNVTVAHVVARSGVSRRTFYNAVERRTRIIKTLVQAIDEGRNESRPPPRESWALSTR